MHAVEASFYKSKLVQTSDQCMAYKSIRHTAQSGGGGGGGGELIVMSAYCYVVGIALTPALIQL